jgi:hypothetical protein
MPRDDNRGGKGAGWGWGWGAGGVHTGRDSRFADMLVSGSKARGIANAATTSANHHPTHILHPTSSLLPVGNWQAIGYLLPRY